MQADAEMQAIGASGEATILTLGFDKAEAQICVCVCVLQAVVDGFRLRGCTRTRTRACSNQLQYGAHTHQQVSGSPLSVFWKKLPAIARLHDSWMTSLCSGHGLDTVRRDRAVWHVVWWAVRHLVQLLFGASLP